MSYPPTLGIALARAVGKLPGAPTSVLARLDTAYQRTNGLGWRDPDGLGWVQDPEDFARYVLDLDDAATGGVMLARMGADHGVICTAEGWSVCNHRDPRAQVYGGPTLGIALARLIIARGGWNV